MCHLYLVLIPVFLFVILGRLSYNIILWSVVSVVFIVFKSLTHPTQITYLMKFNLPVRFFVFAGFFLQIRCVLAHYNVYLAVNSSER